MYTLVNVQTYPEFHLVEWQNNTFRDRRNADELFSALQRELHSTKGV